MLFKVSVIAALVASAAALRITAPTNASDVDLTKDIEIQWEAVSSDPATFTIQIVNLAVYPPTTINVADGVSSSAKTYTLKGGSVTVTNGKGFQVNFISKDPLSLNSILAQSQQLNVIASGSTATSSHASSGSAAATGSACK